MFRPDLGADAGGPSNSSEVIATYMFKKAFQANNWAMAAHWLLYSFNIAFVAAMAFILITRQRQED